MKEKFQRFMMGRYGTDSLNRFLLGSSVVILVISMFMRRGNMLYSFALLLILICYVRMFSRNLQARYNENVKFYNMKNRVLGFWNKQKSYMAQRKTHHIYKCPTCKQKIRVPKGKGKIMITCPRCKTEFMKNS